MEQQNVNKKPLVLVVDDIPANLHLLQTYLISAGYDINLAKNGEEALESVRAQLPDLILLDVVMPRLDGFETCRILKHNPDTHHIPIIMVTALNELEDKIKGIEAGADDFLTKPFNRLELLARAKSLLRIKYLHDQLQEKVRQLEQAKERLRELAVTDGLTGLHNYRYFKEYLDQEMRRAERHRLFVSLLMLDIDFFKHYNDNQGHVAGDEVLRTIAKLIRANIRSIDVAARYGGEEFAIILPVTSKPSSRIVAEKVRLLVEHFVFAKQEKQPSGNLTVSIGVATFPDDAKNSDELVKCADLRLYRAKTGGRNRVVDE